MLNEGEKCLIFKHCVTGANVSEKTVSIEASGALIALSVTSISGTLDVNIYTLDGSGQEVLRDSFPQITAPTAELLIRKAVDLHDQMRIEVVTSDDACYSVRVKGTSGSLSSVRIAGANTFRVSKIVVGTANTVIIPADLDDRNGIAIRNGDFDKPLNTLYVAHDEATLDAGDGYPVLPGEALQIDVKAGNSIWGKFENEANNVHIIETGD